MSISRWRDTRRFGRAKLGRWTLALLIALRWYAMIALVITIYAFFHATR